MRSQCNYMQYNSDTDSGEGGRSVGAKVGWLAVTIGSHPHKRGELILQKIIFDAQYVLYLQTVGDYQN
jgi:hypothetical protein